MRKYFIVVVIAIVLLGGFLAGALFRDDAVVPEIPVDVGQPKYALHAYGDPSVSLEQIDVTVVYFIPKDESDYGKLTPGATIELFRSQASGEIFKNIEEFHQREFDGRSQIRFQVYPDVVEGLNAGAYYQDDIGLGDKQTYELLVAQEIRTRLKPSGDLFRPGFLDEDGVFSVLFIVYSGLLEKDPRIGGAADDFGSNIVVLVPEYTREFRNHLKIFGSIIYHELIHAMGAPEFYKYTRDLTRPLEDIYTRNDIMGSGVLDGLLSTYVDYDIKGEFGFYK